MRLSLPEALVWDDLHRCASKASRVLEPVVGSVEKALAFQDNAPLRGREPNNALSLEAGLAGGACR
jgi:hypothetical protein